MNTEWLESSSDRLARVLQLAAVNVQRLGDPDKQRRVQQGLYALAAIWLVFTVASLIWSLLPQPASPATAAVIINPLSGPAAAGVRANVDVEELAGWNLFGTAATQAPVIAEPEEVAPTADELAGIEKNAKETRLNLTLRGIVSSSDAGSALAIIESKKAQEQYGVGDELPLSGKVTVAKILSDRVVLDNGGRYELLLLFDTDNAITGNVPAATPTKSAAIGKRMDKRGNRDVTQMAESYRRKLYSNPQSLAQVVKISAVRDGGMLRGYKVSAGRDREQFAALGFQPNDIVTGVNGIELTDPSKAMELYRVMRSASEASFSVLRGDEEVTLVVGLGQENEAP